VAKKKAARKVVVAVTKLPKLPPPSTCRLIDFEKATVVWPIMKTKIEVPCNPVLIVKGKKHPNMDVMLLPIWYLVKPDWWGIEVVGCMKAPSILPVLEPFTAHLVLAGTIGYKGIVVIGATKKVQIPIDTGIDT
jgi:hypothetical protein